MKPFSNDVPSRSSSHSTVASKVLATPLTFSGDPALTTPPRAGSSTQMGATCSSTAPCSLGRVNVDDAG